MGNGPIPGVFFIPACSDLLGEVKDECSRCQVLIFIFENLESAESGIQLTQKFGSGRGHLYNFYHDHKRSGGWGPFKICVLYVNSRKNVCFPLPLPHVATYIQQEKNQSYTMRVVSPSIQTSRHVSIQTQKVSFSYLLVFGHLVISRLINPWISETLLNTQPCQSRQPKASAAVRSSNI